MRWETAGSFAFVAILMGACSYSSPATVTDGSGLPVASFATTATLVDENSGTVVIGIELSEPGSAEVGFRVSGGSATRPGDFTLDDGTVSFVGSTIEHIELAIAMDSLEEPDETIELELVNPIGATLGASQHTITISSDILPRVSIQGGSVSTMEDVASQNVRLHLDLAPKVPVGVQLAIGGTATGGVDHDLVTQTVMFGVGITDVDIPFAVEEDTLDEFDETIDMTLQSPSGVVIDASGSTASHVILDNDNAPNVFFQNGSATRAENVANADQVVQLSAKSGKIVTVNYSVTAGAASAVDDFTVTGTQLVFMPGEDTKTIPIAVLEDTVDEPTETATVSLAVDANSNATLGATPDFVLTITDNDSAPDLSFAAPTTNATEGTTATVDITVKLSAKSGLPVSVDFARDPSSTAIAPDDITFVTASPLTFAPGEDTKTITVAITNDAIGEPTETLKIQLSNPSNAGLPAATSSHAVVIADDDLCLGSGNFTVCPPATVAGNQTLTGTLNTSSSTLCGAQPNGWTTTLGQPAVCVIYADNITIPAGGLKLGGTRPLVLFATTAISIAGTLDGSAVTTTNGPGSNVAGTCGTFPATPGGNSNGGGGGAGGSFMTIGGDGGTGNNGNVIAGGAAPADATDPTILRGGCKAQNGGNGTGNTHGSGGGGGGAIYLVAGGAISISGNIDVSGALGSGGLQSRGGGGGAGSGGMILIDGGTVSSTGILIGNGGGAGQGADDNTNGGPGSDPALGNPTNPALGGNINNAGGAGGNGFAGASAATTGTGGATNAGGGGGGGGGGFIKSSAALGGTVSAGKIEP